MQLRGGATREGHRLEVCHIAEALCNCMAETQPGHEKD